MADFVAVIRKAVDNLSENTAENRVKVYDKARAAIRRQLEAISPKPSEDVIGRQLEKLDVAIREVESEHAEALPADEEETDRLMAELEALVEHGKPITPPVSAPAVSAPAVSAPAVAPQPASAYAPKPAPAPTYPSTPAYTPPAPAAAPPKPAFTAAEAYRPAPIQPAPPVFEPTPYPAPKPISYREEPMVAVSPPSRPAAPPVSFDSAADKPPFITGDDHDDAFGLNEPRQPRAEPRRMAQKPKKKKSGGLGWVLGAAVLLLLAGAGYAAWSQRDALTAMFSGSDTPTPVAVPAPTEGATPAAPTETAAAPAATPADDAKFTQRLNPDGTETDAGPAPEAGDTGPVEGRSVAALTETGPVDTGNPATSAPAGEDEATNGGETAAGATPAQPDPATPAAAAPIGVSQKMFLYEERLDQQSPAVTDGAVVWSEIEEAGADGRADVAIRGEISAGADGLTALVTIKRNLDSSLPASHIIEIVFALPPGFPAGSVDQVQRINMKQTEQDQGEALIAVPAQITPDFYMVALNDLKEAVDTNVRLLRERSWIDIPIVYANGRRALITLEKGTSGSEVFTKVLDAWSRG